MSVWSWWPAGHNNYGVVVGMVVDAVVHVRRRNNDLDIIVRHAGHAHLQYASSTTFCIRINSAFVLAKAAVKNSRRKIKETPTWIRQLPSMIFCFPNRALTDRAQHTLHVQLFSLWNMNKEHSKGRKKTMLEWTLELGIPNFYDAWISIDFQLICLRINIALPSRDLCLRVESSLIKSQFTYQGGSLEETVAWRCVSTLGVVYDCGKQELCFISRSFIDTNPINTPGEIARQMEIKVLVAR